MNICNRTVRISDHGLRSTAASRDTSWRGSPNRPKSSIKLCLIRFVCGDRIWESSGHRCLCDSNNLLFCHARLGSRSSATKSKQAEKKKLFVQARDRALEIVQEIESALDPSRKNIRVKDLQDEFIKAHETYKFDREIFRRYKSNRK